jgi:hypothetical protein
MRRGQGTNGYDALNKVKTAARGDRPAAHNEQYKKWRGRIVARTEKTKADNERTRGEEASRRAGVTASASSQTNRPCQAVTPGGRKAREQQQRYLATAIENYQASSVHPRATLERNQELQATARPEKTLEKYRLSGRSERGHPHSGDEGHPPIRRPPKYNEPLQSTEKASRSIALQPRDVEKDDQNMQSTSTTAGSRILARRPVLERG